MAGLLDLFSGDAGLLTGLALMEAGSAKPVRTSTAGGLLSAITNTQQMMQAQEDRKLKQRMTALQEQQLMQALAAQKQQQEEAAKARANEEAFRGLIPSPQMQSNMDALRGGGGPTQANAARVQSVDPLAAMLHQGMRLGQVKPTDYLSTLQPKPADYKVVGDALVQVGPGGVKEAYRAPEKPETTTSMREFNFAQGNPAFLKFLSEQANLKAPKTTVEVNTGQKGFDNTLKLRGDFRSEPVYKAHQEMQSAYSQIQQSLKQQSPAGDLAGATKIMKLLDPGSVVRESELGMAMAASGLLDRVQNYATNIMKGTKLTPTQRADFQRLADALYSESVNAYNSKRVEYQGIAERNGLNVPDVLGPESSAPKRRTVDFGELK